MYLYLRFVFGTRQTLLYLVFFHFMYLLQHIFMLSTQSIITTQSTVLLLHICILYVVYIDFSDHEFVTIFLSFSFS
jgi:hypothetical protein